MMVHMTYAKKELFYQSIFLVLLFAFSLLFSIIFISSVTSFSNEVAQATKQYVVFGEHNDIIRSSYATEEAVHLQEVREVFLRALFACYFLLLLISYLVYYNKDAIFAYYFGLVFKRFVLSFALFFIVIGFFFEQAFTFLHKLFFTAQWSFPRDSLLIQLFPESFWFSKGIETAILAFAVFAFFCFVFSHQKKRRYWWKK